jgi:hypothetical protein
MIPSCVAVFLIVNRLSSSWQHLLWSVFIIWVKRLLRHIEGLIFLRLHLEVSFLTWFGFLGKDKDGSYHQA